METINFMGLNRRSILKLAFIAFVLALMWNLTILCFYTTYRITGSSMETTLHSGEKVVVNKLVYHIVKPHRGEVVILHATKETDFIKRVIGVGGDKVEINNDVLLINDSPVDESYLRKNRDKVKLLGIPLTKDFGPVIIPKNSIFVMGDNRNNSVDSREIGMINLNDIVGRAELVYFPRNGFRLIK